MSPSCGAGISLGEYAAWKSSTGEATTVTVYGTSDDSSRYSECALRLRRGRLICWLFEVPPVAADAEFSSSAPKDDNAEAVRFSFSFRGVQVWDSCAVDAASWIAGESLGTSRPKSFLYLRRASRYKESNLAVSRLLERSVEGSWNATRALPFESSGCISK